MQTLPYKRMAFYLASHRNLRALLAYGLTLPRLERRGILLSTR